MTVCRGHLPFHIGRVISPLRGLLACQQTRRPWYCKLRLCLCMGCGCRDGAEERRGNSFLNRSEVDLAFALFSGALLFPKPNALSRAERAASRCTLLDCRPL